MLRCSFQIENSRETAWIHCSSLFFSDPESHVPLLQAWWTLYISPLSFLSSGPATLARKPARAKFKLLHIHLFQT